MGSTVSSYFILQLKTWASLSCLVLSAGLSEQFFKSFSGNSCRWVTISSLSVRVCVCLCCRATDRAVEPLKADLVELEQLIKDQQDKICAVKSNILKNEEKIQKMVTGMNSSSRTWRSLTLINALMTCTGTNTSPFRMMKRTFFLEVKVGRDQTLHFHVFFLRMDPNTLLHNQGGKETSFVGSEVRLYSNMWLNGNSLVVKSEVY